MHEIGTRLKEERVRLKYSQKDFAAIGGVKANAQYKYEQGRRSPSALYLSQLADIGIDVQYVVTGRHSRGSDQSEFFSIFCQLTLRERRIVTELMEYFFNRY
ncbi:helix-turn-helix domain-containing protein [Pseudomonas orientalis]|uniref:HTH cro/C1-type domain-containing protein n=1 Tax=Pseudomonas orientalis TaxID=76758 RepID=A0A2L0RYP3_9PSED|nr:helix-turn-helix transcriptional regulator [Pseudomonas orientalis]AUZ46874.1 hypothetical protein BOP93_15115 [Pseudomonas orientalis]